MQGDLTELLWRNYRQDPVDGKWVFNSAGFYRDWFRGPESTPYFFLFKKNLAVTNLQFAELLALLRTYTTRREEPGRPHLQFYSTAEFNRRVRKLLSSLADHRDNSDVADDEVIRGVCQRFEQHWGELFERTVVIDAFYGSCVAFLPPCLELDLATACGVSGYIHSCGPSVWARKVGKADPGELIEKLRARVPNKAGLRAMFAVYSHEDFTEFDREEASELRDGLDDVKIWVGKYWMDRERLVSVLNRMSAAIPGLEVAGSGDYREVREELHNRDDIDKDRCFWLIVDRGISDDGQHASRERYYHCYEQRYCNESPLHTFDENKPAWRSHTTLPHTLTGAMLNLSLPYWSRKEPRLIDPFVGTGTTLLEAGKFNNLKVTGIDNDPLAPLLVADNLHFFTQGASGLRKLRAFLAHVILLEEKRGDLDIVEADLVRAEAWKDISLEDEEVEGLLADPRKNEAAISAYQKAELMVAPVAEHPEDEVTLEAERVAELAEQWSFEERLLFYVGLRAVRRNVGARGEEEGARYRQAWLSEAKVLLRQVTHVLIRADRSALPESNEGVRVFTGFYSRACAGATGGLERIAEQEGVVVCGDAATLEGSFDLMITDPPYGFNTDADASKLAKLFQDIIERTLVCMSDGGQVVMALPEQSFVGRDPAFFADRKFVEQQVAARAHDLGLELVSSAEVVPSSPPIFEGPYYWESERALRRSIVHYRIGPESSKRAETGEFAPVAVSEA